MSMFDSGKHKRDAHGRWANTGGRRTKVEQALSPQEHAGEAKRHADKAEKFAKQVSKLADEPGRGAHAAREAAAAGAEKHAAKAVAHSDAAKQAIARDGATKSERAAIDEAEKHANRAIDAHESAQTEKGAGPISKGGEQAEAAARRPGISNADAPKPGRHTSHDGMVATTVERLESGATHIKHVMDQHKDTQEMYRTDTERTMPAHAWERHEAVWHPSRQPIHEGYVKAVEKDVPKSTRREGQTAFMTGGGPASGKTAALLDHPEVTGLPGKREAAHVSADDAKEHIPEYQHATKYDKEDREAGGRGDDRAGSFAHEESSHMAKAAMSHALKSGRDMVLDSTNDNGIDNVEARVKKLRDDGAKRVVAHYATIDVNEAIRREAPRAARTGRKVPESYMRAVHQGVTDTIQAAIKRGTFDELHVWDTGVKKGEAPIHVASYTRQGGLKVHDQAAYEKFQARGTQGSQPGEATGRKAA